MSSQRRGAGFTLIEAMVTVAVIGLLAAIALPVYTDYIRRGAIPDGLNALAAFQVKMEQYFQDNRRYGVGVECATGAGWTFAGSPSKYFSFACDNDGTSALPHYVITATGSGAAAGHVYTIDSANNKSTTGFKGVAQADKHCWLMSGSEC
ncbi:MAG: prepilin-type N-terminal cleavage/methylation domain-containing protein [Burkholderiales bacterium]|nr:prepilin-type N-terminal cleavage/methylation domain-containing protein [Burkholderiales bacterium]